VLNAIRRCYTELDKFWTEEIRRAAKALETRRVDPEDAKRWRDFKASLEHTTKSWKVCPHAFALCREQTNDECYRLPDKAVVPGAYLNYQVPPFVHSPSRTAFRY
jgi:hypothetical protein